MAQNSEIEWCDHTFSPWHGCTKVGPGCDHCYAESMNNRFKGGNWGPGAPRRRTSEANWKLPLRWNKIAKLGRFVECDVCGLREIRKRDDALPPGGLACCSNPDCTALPESESFSVRPRVFCASMADVFDNEVNPSWRADLFRLINATPNLDWLILTKRIGNAVQMINQALNDGHLRTSGSMPWPWSHVWLGATVVNQEEADRDIPKLLEVPAAVRFLSMEPLLGPVDLTEWLYRGDHGLADQDPLAAAMLGMGVESGNAWVRPGIDWVITGGESGPGARPMHPDWVRSIRDQCQAAGVPFFMKQITNDKGQKIPMDQWSQDLRIQEYPNGL